MEYQEIAEQIKESPALLIGIGGELQVKPEEAGADAVNIDYAAGLLRLEACGGQALIPYRRAYDTLRSLTKEKDYFIVSTNTDGMAERMGLDTERLVSPCGSVFRMQCEEPEHGVWEIREALLSGGSTDCPVCGRPGKLNIFDSKPYNEAGYLRQWEAYTKWLQKTVNRPLFLLELGEGFGTPTVIRWPFEKIAYINQKAVFVRVNKSLPQLTKELKERAYSFREDSMDFLGKIAELFR